MMAPLALLLLAAPDTAATRVLDDFERLDGWSAHPSDGVDASLHAARGHHGRGLRLDFDFHGGAGYAIIHRPILIDFPPNYAITFWIRATAPPNTLEFKLVDSTGENVWWYTQRDRTFSPAWEQVTIRRRQVTFAWGPLGGGELTRAAALEFAISAGSGGRGSIWFDDLRLTALPVVGPYDRTPLATATTAAPGSAAGRALDGDTTTAWRSGPAVRQALTFDFRQPREFGGLTLLWECGGAATGYDIRLSDDGRTWRTVRRVRGGDGGRDDLYLPDSEARFLEIALRAREGRAPYGLREAIVQPLDYGSSLNAFFARVAAADAPGVYPRYLLGQRADWTVIGVDGAREEALINEDGAVEAGKGEFSIEPFLLEAGFLSWHAVQTRVSLVDGALPMPAVRWEAGDLTLDVTAFALGPAAASSAILRYRVTNHGTEARRPTLALAIRPFQVNPPSQFLNTRGGVARIDSLRWDGRALHVNGARSVIPLTAPTAVSATTFDGGEIASHLRAGRWPAATAARDPFGAASAALLWSLNLAPGDSADFAIDLPLTPGGPGNLAPGRPGAVEKAMTAVAMNWRRRLLRTRITLPPVGEALARSIEATQGWILVNRDGPAIQPGSRSYERSWIRDGALTSAALLRFGHREVVRDFIEWFARFQYPNGKIPCCVDARGADPVPEHDSHGEFIYLVMEYWRHTGDRALLEEMWPHVRKAAVYLDSLRQSERTAEFQSGTARAFYGLLPPSISHEGYSAKPMHSYWDDFFALRGFKDVAQMAAVLGDTAAAGHWSAIRDEFQADLLASIDRAIRDHHIDYIPGAADLGDFDATSTTIAIAPAAVAPQLPGPALRATFERYWGNAAARMRDSSDWEAYTPYELRAVGAVLRLGWKDRALALLRMFLADQEPPEWRQWPEVVWRDRRALKFIGDLPHTWVGSDFLRSAADLFGYEREEDSTLVVGAGLDESWLVAPGVRVDSLRTWWGPLSYTVLREGTRVTFEVAEGVRVPPGGIEVRNPLRQPPRRATLEGAPASLTRENAITLRALPARISFEY